MAAGRRIDVELRDSMKSNTTYTVEFSDAISDLNEGNPIDGFSFAFSTVPHIDTLQISGMVLCAENLELKLRECSWVHTPICRIRR